MTTNTNELINETYGPLARKRPRSSFDKIGFLNVGYWMGVTGGMAAAQLNLIETLVGFLSRRDGTVLDVGCGKGASTKFLATRFDPGKIVGIDITADHLETCRTVAPECRFELMDATQLRFADSTFDNILCIEAAQHFMTRRKFFDEAHRVLAPGGRLAIHDMVFHNADCLDAFEPFLSKGIWPKENCLSDLECYAESLRHAGFSDVRVDDITQFSAMPALDFLAGEATRHLKTKSSKPMQDAMRGLSSKSPWNPQNCSWCMAYAIK